MRVYRVNPEISKKAMRLENRGGKLGIDLSVLECGDAEEGWDSGYIVKIVNRPSLFAKLPLIQLPLQVSK